MVVVVAAVVLAALTTKTLFLVLAGVGVVLAAAGRFGLLSVKCPRCGNRLLAGRSFAPLGDSPELRTGACGACHLPYGTPYDPDLVTLPEHGA